MRHVLVHVIYRNSRDGFVDDITLNELILSRKITRFYRPSQEKWIDIETEPVRCKTTPPDGHVRRASDAEHQNNLFVLALLNCIDQEDAELVRKRPRGLLSKLFSRRSEPAAPVRTLTAQEWFEKGFVTFNTEDDDIGALLAFAKSISIDPTQKRAFLNRAIVFERIGNLHQAIDDYCSAIALDPGDAGIYYKRGIARERLGQNEEATQDLETAARLGFRPAINYFKSKGIFF